MVCGTDRRRDRGNRNRTGEFSALPFCAGYHGCVNRDAGRQADSG